MNIFQQYQWAILPGRKVAHAINIFQTENTNNVVGYCNQTKIYKEDEVIKVDQLNPSFGRCEQCVITLISKISSGKFKLNKEERKIRKKVWRDYREKITTKL